MRADNTGVVGSVPERRDNGDKAEGDGGTLDLHGERMSLRL